MSSAPTPNTEATPEEIEAACREMWPGWETVGEWGSQKAAYDDARRKMSAALTAAYAIRLPPLLAELERLRAQAVVDEQRFVKWMERAKFAAQQRDVAQAALASTISDETWDCSCKSLAAAKAKLAAAEAEKDEARRAEQNLRAELGRTAEQLAYHVDQETRWKLMANDAAEEIDPLTAKLAKATAVVEAAERWQHAYIDYEAKFDNDALTGAEDRAIADNYYIACRTLNAALANFHAGPAETETPGGEA